MRAILCAAALAAFLSLPPAPARADEADDVASEIQCPYATLSEAQQAFIDKAVADPDGNELAAAVELVTTSARHCALVYDWPEERIGVARDLTLAGRLARFQIDRLGDERVASRLRDQVIALSDEEGSAIDRAGEAGTANDAALNARVQQMLDNAGVKPAQRKAALPLLFTDVGISLLLTTW